MLLLTLCVSIFDRRKRTPPPPHSHLRNAPKILSFLEHLSFTNLDKYLECKCIVLKLFLFLKTKKLRLFSQVFHFRLKFVWIKNSYWRNFTPLSKIWSSWYTSLLFPKDRQLEMPQHIHKHWTHNNDASVEDDVDGDVFLSFGQFVVMRWGQKTETGGGHTYQRRNTNRNTCLAIRFFSTPL